MQDHSKKFNLAYLRLAAFYTLIVMAISIIFSFTIYRIASVEINRGLGGQSNVMRNFYESRIIAELDRLRIDQINESNANLKINLFYFNLLILMLSAGGSYLLARKTLKPIKEALEAQSRFTADASHELRTPLTAMKSEIEVSLRDKNLTPGEFRKLLASNLEEINKLEVLSSELLKLARNENEHRQIGEVDLEEVIIDAYEKIAGLAEKRSIDFENDLSKVLISGDRQSLVDLFVILFENAIKYSPSKSTIRISIKQLDGRAIVSVKDEGFGINASDLPYIFDRFYRADSSRNKEKTTGYGLGLSIAKQIIRAHRASISVESEPDKGSDFQIAFETLK